MDGIVSLLDDRHYQLTEDLWSELKSEFGLRGVYRTPFPHFSYHVAEGYALDELEPILERAAQQAEPLTIRASGLGIFSGESPVLYIPVIRTQGLSRFHHAVWHRVESTASGTVDYYAPEHWIPHITIAVQDIHGEVLAAVIRLLGQRELDWEITVSNLSLIEDTGDGQRVRFRFDFEG